MPRALTRLLPLTLVLMSVGLAACGGGDDAPSRQEFVQDAEKICKDTEKALEGFGENVDSPEEAGEAIDKVIERARQAADELEDKLIPALEELKRAIQSKDQQALQEAVTKLQQLEATESDRYARELGIRACAGAA